MTHKKEQPEKPVETVGRGIRTALRNNATAYGFSITITVCYGMVSGKDNLTNPFEAISFGLGAALGFVCFGALAVLIFRGGRISESGQVATFSGVIDFLAVSGAILIGFGLSRINGFWAWPATGAGAAISYLLIGGLDILVARLSSQRTTFGSSQ